MEVLRGRDRRNGRDGGKGEMGPPGAEGERGVAGPTVQGTHILYSGRAGGSSDTHKGGAANYLCLPNDPDHLQYQSGVQGHGHIGGVEYWYAGFPLLSSLNNHNVPCAVCYVATRSVAVMVPAKTQCPTDWTVEYVGYLMAEHHNHNGRV